MNEIVTWNARPTHIAARLVLGSHRAIASDISAAMAALATMSATA